MSRGITAAILVLLMCFSVWTMQGPPLPQEVRFVDSDGDGFDDIEGDVSCEYAAALRCQYQHSCNNELTSEAECGGTN